MKVAILNISIGKYDVYWEEFFKTAEKNFLPDCQKEYFVFTDNKNIYENNNSRVHIYFQENLGWPFNTMKRFNMFKRVESELKGFDYVFFINGNAIFKEKLTKEFINKEKNLIAVIHPGLYGRKMDEMPYERNPQSNAYIPYGKGEYYVQGAFLGGKSEEFINMIEFLDKKTEEDLEKGIVAVWHDESFFNKYILGRKDVQVLGRQYLYYEEYVFPYKPVIMLRNKRKNTSISNMRGKGYVNKESSFDSFKLTLRNLREELFIKIKYRKKLKYVNDCGIFIDNDISKG